jgi:branched-chain amino acid aminotransferase
MINFNGTMVSQDTNILTQNRAFLWRCRFETVKIVNSKIYFRRSLF